jgi:adenylate cyclase
MKRLVKGTLTGLCLAIAGTCFFYSPWGQNIEEALGLALLFQLRGLRQSPEKVIIINIDDSSSDKLKLPANFSKWPRTIHAALIDRLNEYGAKVIAFDVFFAENRDHHQDQLFAEAIRRAGNVILVEEMQHKSFKPPDNSNRSSTLEIDILVPPIQSLADAALALAPFPVPKIPVRVSTTWRFKDSCGNMPTLPTVAFQAATLSQYEELQTLLVAKVPHYTKILPATTEQITTTLSLAETMRHIREIFLKHPRLRENLLTEGSGFKNAERISEASENLQKLIAMYGGESNVVIDFYGPPASQPIFSYYDILSTDGDPGNPIARQIRDKVVFVGAVRNTSFNQKDGFHTVFSQSDGLDLSGVELAATVFTNLSENRFVHQPSPEVTIALMFTCAVVACLISFLLTPPTAGSLLLGGILLYLVGSHFAFAHNATWPPLIIPIIFMPFLAFLWANLSNYLTAFRERRNISTALGFYLPVNVVAELTKDLAYISKGDKKVYSTCLLTDAENYTTLSENMVPEELSAHLKEYYQYVFREVKKMNGIVCNIIGDSMLAHWPSVQPEVRLRESGCQAALRIAEAVERFNIKHPGKLLPTRIGLHCGYLLLDNIGAEDHYEYAPVGDIVNTVSRIEGLNKQLATQILASAKTLQGVTGVVSREVGLFLLSGKTKPITIHEVFSAKDQTANLKHLYEEAFPAALVLFQKGQWNNSLKGFEYCLSLHAEDGPSRFYRKLCETYLQKPPSPDWQGVIEVSK